MNFWSSEFFSSDVIWCVKQPHLSHSLSLFRYCSISQDVWTNRAHFTRVGDQIRWQTAPGTPAMVCNLQHHQPLMAFEGTWLLTSWNSWNAPDRKVCVYKQQQREKQQDFRGHTVWLCPVCPAALWDQLLIILVTKLPLKQRGLTWKNRRVKNLKNKRNMDL